MAKRINWFDANRSMALEVCDFMKAFVWKAEIHAKFKAEKEEVDHALAQLEKLEGSIFEDKIPEMRSVYMGRLAELDRQEKEQIELEGTYTLSEADKTLKKGLADYAKGKGDAVKALQTWFAHHGLELEEDCPLFDEIFAAAGEKIAVKTLVHTEGKVATGFNNTNAFKMTFAKCYEHMVNAGTIKATQIPPLMAEKYAPKKRTKKARKATKAA